MTNTRRHLARRPAPLLAVALAAAFVAGCGGDDDTDVADEPAATDAPDATETPATEPPATDVLTTDASDGDAFCDGFLGVERAMSEAPQDEADIAAFVDERVTPNLDLIDGNEPANIAGEVQTMTAAVEHATSTGDFAALESPEVLAASATVYSSLGDACGVNVVEFSAVDFDYAGIPDTLPSGPTSFVMTNDSAAGEAHEFSLVKLADNTDLTVDELLAMPEADAEQHIETFAGGVFAPAGTTSGTVAELTAGRWAYVCFIPIGSVDGVEADGPPHFTAGMAGEFTVN